MVKKALILGSARCLRADIRAALELGEFDGVVACKGAGLEWNGRLDAWVSLHPERMPKDIRQRARLGYPAAARTYGHRRVDGVSHHTQYKFDCQKHTGSSGLFALKVAIVDLGFDRCVLCGIPLDKEAGRIDGRDHWSGSRSFQLGWQQALPLIKDKARSWSGFTGQLLGKPTIEWLEN